MTEMLAPGGQNENKTHYLIYDDICFLLSFCNRPISNRY